MVASNGWQSQSKQGCPGERDVLNAFIEAGFTGTRGFQSGGQGGGDLTGDMPDVVEVKRTAGPVRFWAWVEQASSAASSWALVLRRDRDEWLTVIPFTRYMELIVLEREGKA